MWKLLIAIVVVLAVVLCAGREQFAPAANTSRHVVLHYAHWCPGCQQMRPVYAEVRRRLAGRPIIMGEHDEEVSRTPGVTKYPTIYMLDEYGSKREYRGRANLAELTKFILAPL